MTRERKKRATFTPDPGPVEALAHLVWLDLNTHGKLPGGHVRQVCMAEWEEAVENGMKALRLYGRRPSRPRKWSRP